MAAPGLSALRALAQPLSRRRFGVLLALAGGAVALGYGALLVSFFPNAQGRLGIDYEYFLPLLLAGKYWVAQNGLLAVPRFTPAFCGGLPLLANPQSLFYSLPQLLALALDPVSAIVATTLASAATGGLGTFLLMRRRFGASLEAASLAAILFFCNGFVLHRMIIGHVTYHVVALLPLICHALLAPLPRAAPERRRRAAGIVAATAALLAYVTYAGAPNILVPMGAGVVAVWLIHALRRGPVLSFWPLGAGAALLAAAVSAAKLAPALALLAEFPRPDKVLIFANAPAMLYGLFVGLFLPWQLPDRLAIVLRHEMELGLGPVPLLLLVAGAIVAIRDGGALGWLKRLDWRRAALVAALLLLLALPLWLNYGDAAHAALLKSLPYVGDNVVLVRWFFIYLLPLALAAGLILDATAAAAQRGALALVGIALTAVTTLALSNRAYYDAQPYLPTAVLAADQLLAASGKAPAVTRIVATEFGHRNDGLAGGASSVPCYEPIFGYRLERFPPGLEPGPILAAAGEGRHLRDPACYIYGGANGCAPGAGFGAAQREEEAAFAAYKPFAYALPWWQRLADAASLGGLALIVIGFAMAWQGRAARLARDDDGGQPS